MFWGLIMEPQRRYTQRVKKAFHISMASLDLSTSSDEPAQVMCGFEGRNYLLCTLRKPDLLQCPLDLNFEVGDELSLAANGKCHVHLTGYLTEDFDDLPEEEEDESTEEEEVIEKTKKDKKRNKAGLANGPPAKKTKVADSDEEDMSDTDVRALLEDSLAETDEDDATFASGDEESEDDGDEDDDDDDDESEDVGEEESSLSEAESDEEQVEEQPKQKKKKVKQNGISPKKESQEQSTPKRKEKEMKKQKQQQQNESKSPFKEVQSPKKKSLQGGVVIEEISEGQGPPAKPGKFVSVYYEGRLKQNNKVFDSSKKGAGFSFRLGNGEVIKGWDIGVAGMKVGGKRRITCPAAMAYGAKGSPPAIPGNSTLIFEVELKKVR
ncbi:FK506-binding protein 39kD [Leptinotarsa decemlineata]|uniref:FK506-binding protein 39kD n=1 Tax=Leptinotarsa decemlineata TaxID=7539 RepID=UPI003D309B07